MTTPSLLVTNFTTDLKGMAIMGTGKQRHHLSDHVEDLVFTCAQRNMYILVYMLNIDIRVSDDFSLFVQVPVMHKQKNETAAAYSPCKGSRCVRKERGS